MMRANYRGYRLEASVFERDGKWFGEGLVKHSSDGRVVLSFEGSWDQGEGMLLEKLSREVDAMLDRVIGQQGGTF